MTTSISSNKREVEKWERERETVHTVTVDAIIVIDSDRIENTQNDNNEFETVSVIHARTATLLYHYDVYKFKVRL